jgi:hypothetical protein
LFEGDRDGGQTAGGVEFVADIGEVGFDGGGMDAKDSGDRGVGVSLGDVEKDFRLAGGETDRDESVFGQVNRGLGREAVADLLKLSQLGLQLVGVDGVLVGSIEVWLERSGVEVDAAILGVIEECGECRRMIQFVDLLKELKDIAWLGIGHRQESRCDENTIVKPVASVAIWVNTTIRRG